MFHFLNRRTAVPEAKRPLLNRFGIETVKNYHGHNTKRSFVSETTRRFHISDAKRPLCNRFGIDTVTNL
jgi:hypothetical protein